MKTPSLTDALIPIVFLIGLLTFNVLIYGDDALSGANQTALILSAAVGGVIGVKNKYSWKTIYHGITASISSALPALIILLLIGALAGTWLISGIIPAMIYYGLKILNPTIFLVAACAVSAIVSLATGSSWSTIATIGVALLGIGKALGFGEGIIAGAIISGAYFGDKMSPLSDTTNLAPAMAGTDLFTHIQYMMYTTIPSISLTLIAFLIIGFADTPEAGEIQVTDMIAAIEEKFNISLWLFLVPAIVIFLIVKKMPAAPALLIGSLAGGIFGLIFQPQIIQELGSGSGLLKDGYTVITDAMSRDISVVTSNETVNELLSTGGMAGMMNTIWLIICAMIFGGVMEATGLLEKITKSVVKVAKSTGSLVASTAGTCIFFNITASDQYLAIVVPGKMFAETYKKRGLSPEVLSRTLEDSGTVTSVLVPWNTCGATQSTVLGVSTFAYLPYCFFNIISPFMTVLFAYLNIKIRKIK